MLSLVAEPAVSIPCDTVTTAPTNAVLPSAWVTRPDTEPGGARDTLTVVIDPPVTTFPGKIAVPYPFAETRTSYVPGITFDNVYVPSLTVVEDTTVVFACKASTRAPLIGEPDPVCETLPLTDPMPTVKFRELLDRVPTLTTTGPVVAPEGTDATILLGAVLIGKTLMPLNETATPPAMARFEPVIVTDVPTGPELGVRFEIVGPTVKRAPTLDADPTVTTTAPVVAPGGTGTAIADGLQLEGVARTPLKVTVLLP